MKRDITITLTKREHAHILAALRYTQRMTKTIPRWSADPALAWDCEPESDLFDAVNVKPLSAAQVDDLCERIN